MAKSIPTPKSMSMLSNTPSPRLNSQSPSVFEPGLELTIALVELAPPVPIAMTIPSSTPMPLPPPSELFSFGSCSCPCSSPESPPSSKSPYHARCVRLRCGLQNSACWPLVRTTVTPCSPPRATLLLLFLACSLFVSVLRLVAFFVVLAVERLLLAAEILN
jgi:hypothetical protein